MFYMFVYLYLKYNEISLSNKCFQKVHMNILKIFFFRLPISNFKTPLLKII